MSSNFRLHQRTFSRQASIKYRDETFKIDKLCKYDNYNSGYWYDILYPNSIFASLTNLCFFLRFGLHKYKLLWLVSRLRLKVGDKLRASNSQCNSVVKTTCWVKLKIWTFSYHILSRKKNWKKINISLKLHLTFWISFHILMLKRGK